MKLGSRDKLEPVVRYVTHQTQRSPGLLMCFQVPVCVIIAMLNIYYGCAPAIIRFLVVIRAVFSIIVVSVKHLITDCGIILLVMDGWIFIMISSHLATTGSCVQADVNSDRHAQGTCTCTDKYKHTQIHPQEHIHNHRKHIQKNTHTHTHTHTHEYIYKNT